MSRLISVKLRGELRERFKKEERKKHDEETRSELIRDLLERGLDDRTIPLFARLDLPNRTKAQLENAREEGEPDEEIIRRFLKEAIEYREQDALDAIGAGGRLRSVVEQKQADGEELDETVKRQLRGTVPQREVILSRLAGKKVFTTSAVFSVLALIPLGITSMLSPTSFWELVGVFASFAFFSAGLFALVLSLLSYIVIANPTLNTLSELITTRIRR
jgi:hypothetical protein